MRRTLPLAVVTLLAGLVLACGGSGGAVGGGGAGDVSPAILDLEHPGWKNPQCAACHLLPLDGHTTSRPEECAACHGANGACDPNGIYSLRAHTEYDLCTSCHGQRHGMKHEAECVACHFAATGLDEECSLPGGGGGGLLPPTELFSGCFGWPEADFTPDNHAFVAPSLAEGGSAVDFTLRDPGGTPYTLADLLATRPVLLVTGAFT